MKKKILVLALALAMCLGLAAPAVASELDYDALNANGIRTYGDHEFRDGLMPVLVNGKWNYINENLEVVDLNQGRFEYVFGFYEGRAAVIDYDGGVGYIDTSGNLVVPCIYGDYSGMGVVWTGHFHEGKATVLKSSAHAEMIIYSGTPIHIPGVWEIGKIDINGNLVEPFTTMDMGGDIYRKGLYMLADMGITTDRVVDATEPTVEPEPEGVISQPPQEEDTEVEQFSGLDIKISENTVYESDFGPIYDYTITNGTQEQVEGCYALMTFKPKWHDTGYGEMVICQLHAIELNLAPGESLEGSLTSSFFNMSRLTAVWIKFDSKEERDAFFSSDALMPNNDFYTEKYGLKEAYADEWFQENFGITLERAH